MCTLRWRLVTLSSFLAIVTGCAEPTASKSADPSRAISPVPACVRNLPPRSDGFAQSLPEDDYWGLVIPGWKDAMTEPSELQACNGQLLFQAENFQGAHLDPAARMEGRITYGGGANRLKVVWLRSHRAEDVDVGPLALVRVVQHHAEVYGVTSFRGDPEQIRFDLERLGGEVVVTAISDGCAGVEGDCDSILRVFRPREGVLDEMATIALQRRRGGTGLEPGMPGSMQANLVASPEYTKEGIQLLEAFSLQDEVGRVLRKAQGERNFLLAGSEVVESGESLWERMFEGKPSKVAQATNAPPPASVNKAKSEPEAGGSTKASEQAPIPAAPKTKAEQPSSSSPEQPASVQESKESKIAVDELL